MALETILSNAFKGAITFKSIRFNKVLDLLKSSVEMELVSSLKTTKSTGSEPNVLAVRLALEQHLNLKSEGCTVRANICIKGQHGIHLVRSPRIEESQPANNAIIRSLDNQQV